MVSEGQSIIYRKLGLPPPPDNLTMVFELVDMPGQCIPMVTPTGKSQPSLFGDKTKISICDKAVANEFNGFTTPFKVLVHELTHSYFAYYGGLDYNMKPIEMKEGVALWTAGQTPATDFFKVPFHLRNQRWERYLSYYQNFERWLQRMSPKEITKYLLS